MKVDKSIKQLACVFASLALFTTSCGSITRNLETKTEEATKLGLNFAKEDRTRQQIDSTYKMVLLDTIKMNIDGKEVTVMNAYKDEETGERMADFQLQGIIVETKMRSLPERNGKINMDFIITVPKSLINSRWQLRIYPIAFKTSNERIELEPLLLSGADFLKMQKDGYEQYKRFVASIVPDSLYWKEMINQKGYNRALADLEQDYYKAWAKDLLTKDQWIDWKNKINKRYNLFNSKMRRNRQSIDEQSLLAMLPAYWLERKLDKRTVPTTFAEYAWGNKSIVKQTVTAQDSLEIERKYTDLKKIAENERKKQEQESKYNKLVKFPKIAARLDTIVENKDAFKYYYIQEMDVDGAMKKVKLVLDGDVLAIDLSTYKVPSSDTLTYNVSAMVDFIDEAPRYKKEIVYRQVEKSMKANIEYPVASAEVKEDFSNNQEEFEKVRSMISDIELAEEFVLDSLTMIGYASPEGNSRLNKSLSERRTNNLKAYVQKQRFFTKTPPIRAVAGGENWSGLYEILKSFDELIQDEKVKSNIMGIANSSISEDEREQKIRTLHPAEYAKIKENVYPSLRVTEFRFYTHRANMVQDTIHTTVVDEEYNKGRELLRDRKYKESLSILSEYPNDFNLAVAQMSLGYNLQAKSILETKEPNADILYLLAIIYSRDNEVEKAVNALLRSAELDHRKVFRAQLDPELNRLIEKYNLFAEHLNFN